MIRLLVVTPTEARNAMLIDGSSAHAQAYRALHRSFTRDDTDNVPLSVRKSVVAGISPPRERQRSRGISDRRGELIKTLARSLRNRNYPGIPRLEVRTVETRHGSRPRSDGGLPSPYDPSSS